MASELKSGFTAYRVMGREYKYTNEDPGTQSSTEEQFDIYSSIEDVPINRSDIPPVKFEGLPNYNFIKLQVEANRKVTDAYPEYSMQAGFATLATVVRRRAHFSTNGTETYLNIWPLLLGPSSSRKSVPMDIGEKEIRAAVGETFLPSQCTPETLQKQLACRHEERVKDGELKITELDKQGEIPHGQRTYWLDEAGGFYSQVGKQHMKGVLDLFDKLYGCPKKLPSYALSNETFYLENIFFTMIAATTPQDFFKHMTSSDSRTGYLPRHTIVNPTYVTRRGPIRDTLDSDTYRTDSLIHSLKIINALLGNNDIKLSFEDGILHENGDYNRGLANLWSGEREQYFRERKHDLDSYFGKYQTTALKLAALIDIGNLPYIIAILGESVTDCDEIDLTIKPDDIPSDEEIYRKILAVDLAEVGKLSIKKLTVTKQSFIYAARLFDTVYLPYASAVVSEIGETNGPQQSISDKLYNILQAKGVAIRSELIHKIRACDRTTLNAALNMMVEAGRIKEVKINGKTKPMTAYVYIPKDNEIFTKIPYSGTTMEINDFHTSITIGNGMKFL